jgi:hypothetical protein
MLQPRAPSSDLSLTATRPLRISPFPSATYFRCVYNEPGRCGAEYSDVEGEEAHQELGHCQRVMVFVIFRAGAYLMLRVYQSWYFHDQPHHPTKGTFRSLAAFIRMRIYFRIKFLVFLAC